MAGRPRVRVPVLSQMTAFNFPAVSSTAASRTRIPRSEPRPIPAMTAVGVASPIAQGQATTSTAIALATARTRRGSAPKRYQAAKVARAIRRIVGTKIAEIRSARRAIAGFDPCARSTAATMRASAVLLPTDTARMTIGASRSSVPARMRAPVSRRTGIDSPLIADSSSEAPPRTMIPSTGILSPGRTRMRSPAITRASSTRSVRVASGCGTSSTIDGRKFKSARTAPVVASRARDSIHRPSETKPMISAAASHVACAGTPICISSL